MMIIKADCLPLRIVVVLKWDENEIYKTKMVIKFEYIEIA